jgi:hypothetical protein
MREARPGRVRAVCVATPAGRMWRLDDGSTHETILVGARVRVRAAHYCAGTVYLDAHRPRRRKARESGDA